MANNNAIKRQVIFNKYAANLDLLMSEGLLPGLTKKYDKTYICPICLNQFSEDDLVISKANHLTLEHVPPDALRGKPIVLTCENCNNSCGIETDKHLINRIREMDKRDFLPGALISALFKKSGKVVRGLLEVMEDGLAKVSHSEKHNHPEALKDYIVEIDPKSSDRIVNMEIENSNVDLWKLRVALLKIGYLLTFEKFGYAFILNPEYNDIRRQLRNPEEEIYPPNFFMQAPFPKEYFGVPFITEKKLESIMPIFSLKTNLSERVFSTIIPITSKPIEQVIDGLNNLFDRKKTIEVEMYGFSPEINYLSDVDAIEHLLNWIDRIIA